MSFVLAAIAAAHLTVTAQARPPVVATPPAQAPAAAGTAHISGVMKNAADGKPVARARVIAVSPVLPEPRVAITGNDGKYALADLPAGSYTITATRTGFAP